MKTISAILIIFVIGLFWNYAPTHKEPIKTKPNLEVEIQQKEVYCRKLETNIIERQTFIINNLER